MHKQECKGHPSTSEQLESLKKFARANGRNWKGALRDLWMTGAYNYAILGEADSAHLQQIRNSFGPSWLTKFQIKETANAQK